MEILLQLLFQYAIQVPLLLVWIVGVALALIYRARFPRIALVTSIACACFFLDLIVGTFISFWLPSALLRQGRSATEMSVWLGGINTIRTLLHTVLWAAILFAIFGGRGLFGQAVAPMKNE